MPSPRPHCELESNSAEPDKAETKWSCYLRARGDEPRLRAPRPRSHSGGQRGTWGGAGRLLGGEAYLALQETEAQIPAKKSETSWSNKFWESCGALTSRSEIPAASVSGEVCPCKASGQRCHHDPRQPPSAAASLLGESHWSPLLHLNPQSKPSVEYVGNWWCYYIKHVSS